MRLMKEFSPHSEGCRESLLAASSAGLAQIHILGRWLCCLNAKSSGVHVTRQRRDWMQRKWWHMLVTG